MAKRVGLTQCINPQHRDSTPSMAVYDHGKEDKLQVFCFGCKFHAWVTPEQVPVNKEDKGAKDKPVPIVTYGDNQTVKEQVDQFFKDRNIKTPWHLIKWGTESPPYFSSSFSQRPFIEWDLLSSNGIVKGSQRRYLDDKTPKTKYFPDKEGNYAKEAWVKFNYTYVANNPRYKWPVTTTLAICESWVDAVFVNQRLTDVDVMTILGTDTKHIESRLYDLNILYDEIWLFFDGDNPGWKAGNHMTGAGHLSDVRVQNYIVDGKKVYELDL